MSTLVTVALLALFFGVATLLMIVLVMRAPIIEDFDEVSRSKESPITERVSATQAQRQKPSQPRPVSIDSPSVFVPHSHARQSVSMGGQVNLPR